MRIKKVVIRFFAGLIGILLATLAVFQLLGLPHYETDPPELSVEISPQRINKGRSIVSTICAGCHLSPQTNLLSGKLYSEERDFTGKIYASNITKDSIYGLGSWTDGEIYYLLRTGVNKDGHHCLVMPAFNLLSEEDVFSIIAFLRTDTILVQPHPEPMPQSKYSLLTKILSRTWGRPFEIGTYPPTSPDSTDLISYGRYLVSATYFCALCHTPVDRFKPFGKAYDFFDQEQNEGFLSGGKLNSKGDGYNLYSRNITPDMNSGIGSWTLEEFAKAIRKGQTPNGDFLRRPMMQFKNMSDNDLAAIYLYLKTIPPINNDF